MMCNGIFEGGDVGICIGSFIYNIRFNTVVLVADDQKRLADVETDLEK